jgi:hypothetical protein
MESFLNGCNRQEKDLPFCLYGIVSAMWVVAVASWHDKNYAETLLNHSRYLLGSHTK